LIPLQVDNNTYVLQLTDSITDQLDMNIMTVKSERCCGMVPKVLWLKLNDEQLKGGQTAVIKKQ
jgi:hypothetical protein